MKEKSVYKKTDDQWYGNFNSDECRLSICKAGRYYRVSVWGNDDFGIEKDFDSSFAAEMTFSDLSNAEKINHADLYDLGFVAA
jgi:hypothetical protein